MNGVATCLAMAAAALGGAASAAGMTLASDDIRPNGPISLQQVCTRCGGQNVSPEIVWSGAPPETRSLVLTMIDLDVKPAQFSHWIVVDLPPTARGIPRGAGTLPGAARAVAGNFGDAAYDGPCPPKGSGVHHYRFTIWAMPAPVTIVAADAPADALAARLAKRAIASASFVGTERR